MEAVRLWAASLTRRNWRATVLLALLAGIAGGVAVGAWSVGRRTATAFDRFVQRSDLPDLQITFCPPGTTSVDEESIFRCWAYDAEEELPLVQRLPEVEAAGRGSWRGLTVAKPSAPDATLVTAGMFARDRSLPSADGQSLVVDGRWYDVDAPDEVVINELLADRTAVSAGDRLVVTFWAPDELGMTGPGDGTRFHGPTTTVRVVGVFRGVRDIAARQGTANALTDDSLLLGGPALSAATSDAAGFQALLVEARDGDAAATMAAVERAFAGRGFNIVPTFGPAELAPVREAINYEANAALAFAALAGLAAAVFVGQAVARQGRREWADVDVLHALGLTRRQALLTAALRGAPTAGGAVLVATALAIAISPAGPIGVARTTERVHSAYVDWLPLTVGGVLVLSVVLLATCVPVIRMRRTTVVATAGGARERGVPLGLLPPPATVGVTMAVNGGRDGNGLPFGTAIASVALAVATLVASMTLGASLTALSSSPERFGAPWDFSFAQPFDSTRGGDPAETFLAGSADVAAAAGIVGADVEIDGRVFWAQSFQPVPGVDDVIRPPITGGREPVRPDEIALGAITMRQLGVGIGDTVSVASTVTIAKPTPMTVVGRTVINDTYEDSPGTGAAVTADWLVENAPEAASPDPYVVRLEPGADRAAFRAEIERRFGTGVSGPAEQTAIRNVKRIRSLPFALAAIVGVLAISSLAHAVVLTARRHRGQLAVLRTLGFSRGQAAAAVRWQATALGLAAVTIGLPAGVIAGRWGWRVVTGQLGVASGPVVPLLAVAAVAAGVAVTAHLIAVIPAWRVTRSRPATAFRSE